MYPLAKTANRERTCRWTSASTSPGANHYESGPARATASCAESGLGAAWYGNGDITCDRNLWSIMRLCARNVPTRLATGAFVLHSGLEKWSGSEQQAQGVHGMASGAFPFLTKVAPPTFLKALSVAEIGVGAGLLVPLVPNRLAGAALAAFSGGLLAMYLRTPALHKPGSVWPTPNGIAVSKDVWMFGIGLGLLADG
jgi:uncharacterized membrane protein YphA (DoxX/SURF4 family)